MASNSQDPYSPINYYRVVSKTNLDAIVSEITLCITWEVMLLIMLSNCDDVLPIYVEDYWSDEDAFQKNYMSGRSGLGYLYVKEPTICTFCLGYVNKGGGIMISLQDCKPTNKGGFTPPV
ncbi:hypothetical protein K1719_029313 [Acacia pycnantha]|nr:hypothetical protein K1719_029313 [Acacia pycnantha]